MEADHPDYYKILQVDPNAEPEVIAGAYRRLALKYHPDTSKSPGTKRRMQDINLAYEVLSDPVKRASYDAVRNMQTAKLGAERNTPAGRDSERARSTGSQSDGFKRELVYQSDFYSPSNQWREERLAHTQAFTQDGHYHVAVSRPDWLQSQTYRFYVKDFAVYADAQLARKSGNTATCGFVFRVLERHDGFYDYYMFAVSRSGYYSLALFRDREWKVLLEYRFSEYLRRDYGVNRLMVEVVGNRIKLGANGQVLTSVADDSLCLGRVGVHVATTAHDQYAEARFRDFCLYSIETDGITEPWQF